MVKIFYFIFLFLLLSCNKDSVNSQFEPIVKETLYETLKPKESYDYFEIRDYYCFDTIHYNIFYSFGNKLKSDSLIQINYGVKYTNSDICINCNILARKNDDYKVFESYNEILNFLGNIDSNGDALFIAHLNGFYFKFNDGNFGIKQTGTKYQIYAFMLVCMCAPVQVDKFLIEIDSSGKIKILFRTIYSIYENGCI
jgi:hypothetical protein